jgi:hypothetical protein
MELVAQQLEDTNIYRQSILHIYHLQKIQMAIH